jgi:hypothetical protein
MGHNALRAGFFSAIATLGMAFASVPLARSADLNDATCAPSGNVRYICSRGGPEDISYLEGTDWAVISAFSGALGLRLVSVRNAEEVAILYPSADARKKHDTATYRECPGPLSAEGEATFISHGLAITKLSERSFALLVVYHGERESIEVFNLDVASGQRPVVTWVGCAVAPGSAVFNAVAALPGGGFVATNSREKREGWKPLAHFSTFFGDPLANSVSPEFQKRQAAGENTGNVLEWQPKSGWTKLAGSESRPNGIETSKDGKVVYVITDGTKLMRLPRGVSASKPDVADFGVRGDNVKWSADGRKLLIAGNVVRADGTTEGKVVAVDPSSFQVSDLASVSGPVQTGLQVGNQLWMASVQGMRVIVMPMPAMK